jgi:hypothetical protein
VVSRVRRAAPSSLKSAVLRPSWGARFVRTKRTAEVARLPSLVGPGQLAESVFIEVAELADVERINRALVCGVLRPTLLAPNSGENTRRSAAYGRPRCRQGGADAHKDTARKPRPGKRGKLVAPVSVRALGASLARRFVGAGRTHLLLIQSVKVALVDHTIVVDIEIGGCPGVVRPPAGLGVLNGFRELSFEALDFSRVPGCPCLGQLRLQVGECRSRTACRSWPGAHRPARHSRAAWQARPWCGCVRHDS